MAVKETRMAHASRRTVNGRTAVIAVDCQLDFMPGGAMPVPEGDQIIPLVNALLAIADIGCATKDWHDEYDNSFAENGGDWPRHCIATSDGCEVHPDLAVNRIEYWLYKTGYSAFSEFTGQLENRLRKMDITRVVVCGLALDYCVKFTAIDAAKRGFHTYVAIDATRAVNPRSIPDVCDELNLQGVVTCYVRDLIPEVK